MLSVSKTVLKEELTLILRIINKWQQKLEEGVPVVDFPSDDFAFEAYVRELVGEFHLIAGKMDTIATILSEDRG